MTVLGFVVIYSIFISMSNMQGDVKIVIISVKHTLTCLRSVPLNMVIKTSLFHIFFSFGHSFYDNISQ